MSQLQPVDPDFAAKARVTAANYQRVTRFDRAYAFVVGRNRQTAGLDHAVQDLFQDLPRQLLHRRWCASQDAGMTKLVVPSRTDQ